MPPKRDGTQADNFLCCVAAGRRKRSFRKWCEGPQRNEDHSLLARPGDVMCHKGVAMRHSLRPEQVAEQPGLWRRLEEIGGRDPRAFYIFLLSHSKAHAFTRGMRPRSPPDLLRNVPECCYATPTCTCRSSSSCVIVYVCLYMLMWYCHYAGPQ